MLGELSRSEIESVLQQEVIGRIGCSVGSDVLVVPITYAYDGEFVYCHSREGMKIEMMRSNPSVCFQVDKVNDMTNWRSVILWGTYEELKDDAARKTGIQIFSERMKPFVASETLGPMMRQPEPHPPGIGSKPVFFRIKVTKKTGRFERGK
jgi:nitroimidazol reductase NimA-like FMN-containing flavoprotein (pyridoxamine 5'-phosphate oxidase superfamily)